MDYEKAASLVRYDKESGDLFWLNDKYRGGEGSSLAHKKGCLASSVRKDGRKVLRLDGKLYLSYRVAWLLANGSWPKGEIDHINGISSDDRLSNLRDVTRGINQENLRKSYVSKGSSKLLGVFKNKKSKSKPWRSSICVGRKQISLGAFATEEEAHAAYVAAKRVLHSGCTI